ncbi:MAG TPA: TRAP transporter small permease [Longimicrobiales bacterium]|nr:TRAP transporter small permease [Longimicrobiales bacterium]
MSETPGAGKEAPEGRQGAGPRGSLDRVGAWVDRVSERVSWELFRLGIYVAIPALVVLVSTDVTLRYVFNAPLQWARDVNGLLLLVSIFCALPHAWDRSYHIRMEIFYNRLAPAKRRRLDVLASVAGIVFFGLMAVQGARYVPFMIQTNETGEDLLLPIWPFMAFLSVCAFVMVLRVFANPAASEKRLRFGVGAGASGAHQGEDAV